MYEINWRTIETHPEDEDECLIAIFTNGILDVADHGWWEKGEVIEEWDEVEDGIKVKIWEEEQDGRWSSNHCIIDEPTHWAPLPK